MKNLANEFNPSGNAVIHNDADAIAMAYKALNNLPADLKTEIIEKMKAWNDDFLNIKNRQPTGLEFVNKMITLVQTAKERKDDPIGQAMAELKKQIKEN